MNPTQFNSEFLQELLNNLKDIGLNFNFSSGLISIAAYVLMAIGLYTIAKKRGINHPWLAWLPVADLWLLGCISDQYRFVVKGETRNRRKRMLTLAIIEYALTFVMILLIAVLVVQLGTWAVTGMDLTDAVGPIVMACVLLLLMLPLMVVSIWLLVEAFCAYHDLFCSCSPNEKTLFTVLSIVGTCLRLNILASIFVFACRNKEEGMPPRKVEEVPVYQAEEVLTYQEAEAPTYSEN